MHPAWYKYVAADISSTQLGEVYAGALRPNLSTVFSRGLANARGADFDANHVPEVSRLEQLKWLETEELAFDCCCCGLVNAWVQTLSRPGFRG